MDINGRIARDLGHMLRQRNLPYEYNGQTIYCEEVVMTPEETINDPQPGTCSKLLANRDDFVFGIPKEGDTLTSGGRSYPIIRIVSTRNRPHVYITVARDYETTL